MADPRRTATRRAILSYSHLKELTKWPDLLIKDYQGIIEDFNYVADEEDLLEQRIDVNAADIAELQDTKYPNLLAQVQWMQRQIDGLPEFTIDTSGFLTDTSFITVDKAIA